MGIMPRLVIAALALAALGRRRHLVEKATVAGRSDQPQDLGHRDALVLVIPVDDGEDHSWPVATSLTEIA
jgi:hypothetical protein